MVTLTKEKIIDFFKTLEKVSHYELCEPAKQMFDLGLVVFEKESQQNAQNIYQTLPEGRGDFCTIDDSHSPEDFFEKLVMALREGRWLIVDCKIDPAPQIIQILKQLSDSNEFTLNHFENEELFRMKLNPKSRIIFCVKNSFLENKITYPFFITLFGPILRIQ